MNDVDNTAQSTSATPGNESTPPKRKLLFLLKLGPDETPKELAARAMRRAGETGLLKCELPD
jgi:hypothetical protein